MSYRRPLPAAATTRPICSTATTWDSLLLPNRNLDYGYAKLDLGASYKLLSWLGIYAQAENLTDNQHIAPIGYPSLPITIRTGLRVDLGKGSSR